MLRRSKSQVAPADRTRKHSLAKWKALALYNAELKQARKRIGSIRRMGTSAGSDSIFYLRSQDFVKFVATPPGGPGLRIVALLELVSELKDEGHKVLVFSQFVEMLEITERNWKSAKPLI